MNPLRLAPPLVMAFTSLLWSAQARAADAYVGVNPLALATAIPAKTAKIATPLVSGMEFGIAGCFGLDYGRHDLQFRAALGSPHGLDMSFLPQARVGYRFFVREPARDRDRGFHVGADARFWSLLYRTSGEQYASVIPGLTLGWWFDIGRSVFIDLNLEQQLGACSASTLDGTSPACAFYLSPAPAMMPVLPLLSLDVGITRLGGRKGG